MVNIGMDKIVEKLSPLLKLSLEEAAQLAISEGNYNVEIEHWLQSILEKPHTDLDKILRLNAEFEIDQFKAELKLASDDFQSGNTRPPSFSKHLLNLASDAWILASVKYSHQLLTSGHLLMALVESDELSYAFSRQCKEFNNIKKHQIEEQLPKVIGSTTESALINEADRKQAQASAGAALAKFTVDLTEKAKNNEIDPVLGRDDEVRQLIDILLRRRQNNPILTGEPGVGKTAVVEGFANRIVSNDVPDALKGVRLLSLDMGLLQAGASVKGEFEKRLKISDSRSKRINRAHHRIYR